jgi:hypothetical protein
VAEQLALREAQLDMRLIAAQLSLLQPAAIGSPTEDRNLQGGDGRITKIPDAVRSKSEMVGVNSIEVVQRKRWQQPAPGRRHLVTGGLIGSKGGAQVGIVFLACRCHLGERGQRFGTLKIVHHGEILVEISKKHHCEVQASALHGELRFLQIALLLLGLDVSLEHVGMGDLAPGLELLADIEKVRGFGRSSLLIRVLALRHDQAVVGLSDGDDQAAGGDFRPGARHGEGGGRAAVVRDIGEGERLVNVSLADVLMYSVIGDEAGCWTTGRAGLTTCCERSRSLRVDVGRVVVDVGQKQRPSLHAVFARQAQIRDGSAVFRRVLACTLQCILQREGEWSAQILRCCRRLCKTHAGGRQQDQNGKWESHEHPELGGRCSRQLKFFMQIHRAPRSASLGVGNTAK